MRKTLLLSLLCLGMSCLSVYGQDRKITGIISAEDAAEGFAGVSVVVKGTNIGTITDTKGTYTLMAPASAGILVYSAVGMVTVEETIAGRAVIDVKLTIDTRQLSEVIITSLGLKEERDKFASSVSTVNGKNLAKSGETSLLTGLSGKASGVLITRNGGDPGAGAYIQIRGQNTINGNAQPLFIVDGIPVSNSSDNTGTAAGNGIVQQSRINDINPEDIEIMEVLKGASAAALWGTRAANGVIVITTKKGKDSKGKVNISFKSTVSFDRVNKMHKLQQNYGQGTGGLYKQGNKFTFGDLISDRKGGEDTFITTPGAAGYNGYLTFPDGSKRYAIGAGTEANPHGGKNSTDTWDHAKDPFQTGHFIDNSINISGGNAKTNFMLSYSNLDQDGVVKQFSTYNRNTARVNVTSQFTSWFRASANLAYTKTYSSRVQQGDNLDGILLDAMRTPGDFNNDLYTGTYTNPAGQIFNDAHVSFRNPLGVDQSTIYSNPIWNIHNNKNTTDVDRTMGNVELSITPSSWLSVTGRAGIDNFLDDRLERFARNSGSYLGGFLSKSWIHEKQFNTDVFANATKTFNNNFSGSFLLGVNYNNRRKTLLQDGITNLIVPSAPDILANALNSNLTAYNYTSLIRTYAYYAQAEMQAYNMLYDCPELGLLA